MRLKASASCLAITAALGCGGQALAQDRPPAAAAQSRALEEVVVTARKVAENLQNVPVAVTAISGEMLKQQNAVKLSDISGITPGLRITSADYQGPFSLFMLRGQINTTQIATADPSVGVYVDGVYWARSYGVNANLLDVRQVQTLKGPQGTLFGRNTTGGAILIDTNDPDLSALSGELSGSYGRFDYKSGRVIVNVPLVKDRVAIRAGYEKLHDDGYATNVIDPEHKQGQHDSETARIKLRAQVTDDLMVQFSGELWHAKYYGAPEQLQYVVPGSGSILQVGSERLGVGPCFANVANCSAVGQAAIDQQIAQYGGTGRTVALNQPGLVDFKTQSYVGTISYDTAIGNLKVIGGYRRVKGDTSADYDGSQYNLLDFSFAHQNLKQRSIEATLTGEAMDKKLSYAFGAFYFKETGLDQTFVRILNNLLTTGPVFDGDIDNRSAGVYGQATYSITDKLSFTGGLRWSKDKKSVTINNGQGAGPLTTADLTDLTSFTCTVSTGCPSTRSGSFSGVSYTAILDYRFTDDIMGYAKTAKSFRSGGVNLRDTAIVPGFPASFKPEKAINYELGLKSQFWDRRARFNLAAYYTIVKDIQRTYTVTAPGTNSTTTIASNGGRADFWGGEAELNVIAYDTGTDRIELAANGALIETKYVDYLDENNNNFDRSRERFMFVPKWQFTLSGTYTHDFGESDVSLHADYQWEGSYPLDPYNYFVVNGVARNATDNSALPSVAIAQAIKYVTTKKSGGLLNARATYRFGEDKRFELAAWGRNILNNRQIFFPSNVLSLHLSGQRREPATYGVTGTVHF